MDAELSPRAREILASVEQDAARRRALRGTGAGATALAEPPPEVPAPDPSRLLRLVQDVTDQAEAVSYRAQALQAVIDDLAGRLGLAEGAPAGGSSEVAAAIEVPPADAAPIDPRDVRLPTRPAPPEAPPVEPQPAPAQVTAEAPSRLRTVVSPPPGPPRPAPARETLAPTPPAPDASQVYVPVAAPAAGPPRSTPVAPAPAPATAEGDAHGGARLVAVEMAVAGYTRSDVGERLKRHYGIARPEPILDEVFGAGTSGQSRMPWG